MWELRGIIDEEIDVRGDAALEEGSDTTDPNRAKRNLDV